MVLPRLSDSNFPDIEIENIFYRMAWLETRFRLKRMKLRALRKRISMRKRSWKKIIRWLMGKIHPA